MEDRLFFRELSAYYNKFNEEKRLDSRHGQVEFYTSMHFIHRYLEKRMEETGKRKEEIRLLDVGAATGRYSVPLSEEGISVTAVEPVKHNISRLRQKTDRVEAYQADARKMSRLKKDEYDLTLLFGPMYHLQTTEDQLRALEEAKRVTAPGGYILAAYIMNEYAILVHGFRDRKIGQAMRDGAVDGDFMCGPDANPLYHFMRLEQICDLRSAAGLRSVQIISADGAANYMRRELNALSEEEFELFLRYQMSICERQEMIGASAHIIDIMKKKIL